MNGKVGNTMVFTCVRVATLGCYKVTPIYPRLLSRRVEMSRIYRDIGEHGPVCLGCFHSEEFVKIDLPSLL